MPDKGTNKGELPPEVDKYLSALLKDPKSKAFVPLADIYRKAGMLDEAIQVAKDGLKHNPNYLSGRFVLGRCYFDKEMLREAEDEITKVIKGNPENSDAQRVLAKIKEKTGKHDEAIKIWDIILTLLPNDAEAKQRIAELKQTLRTEEKIEPEPSAQVEKKQEISPEVKEVHEPPEEREEREEQKVMEEGITKAEACEIPVSESVKEESETERVEVPPIKEETPAGVPEGPAPESIPVDVTEKLQEVAKEPEKPVEAAERGKDKVEEIEPAEAGEMSQETQEPAKAVEERSENKIDVKEEAKKEEEKAGISTRALAELYIKQGFLERALKVYKELEASSPDDKEIKERINFINIELSKTKDEEPKQTKFKENIKTLSSWLDKIKRGG